MLPASLRRQTVLDEKQLRARLENPSHFYERRERIRAMDRLVTRSR
jgi:hypothetical protein